ncbi:hypothetical protein A2899_03385 [Candidatus Amesbacteria bacterium RIFCSPLOWO2_01_FULL_49_25]|uniref:Ribosomal protein n=1 Tax=Candidatus Amesbacteria bacterium RIFCSPHIGHO2_01_FULL_48_32b TaxID=1797253 RepID=A0A1F4YEK8_9BACT|nr:MAG: hypothetical protein A2876_02275 [Candidatus Amesbacteria bacterium RIFCSPHIGHO2_01_FULL_48_32b]OGD06914.1 MAG: hypothetical protein A2899_03385 [Candidatus Amesbacteria bacterium RIFCSPLOWO2_01_FULL_49_25]
MGKKRISVLGSENEAEVKAKHQRQLEQKKLRAGLQGKTAKAPGLGGGQRVVDTSEESLRELEEIQKRSQALPASAGSPPKKSKVSHIRSQAYTVAKAKIDSHKTYSPANALKLLRQVSLTRFDPTVELHINLKESPKTLGEITLPHASGKSLRVAVADDRLIAEIESGKINFDVLLAQPSQMSKLVKLAKVLGPKGLMPNPKNGTLMDDPSAAVPKFSSANRLTLKTEKSAPVIHTIIGKLSLSDSQLTDNASAILSSLAHIQKVVLKSTMSPAIKLQI